MVDSIRLGCRFLALATLVGGACNVYAQMRGCGILNVYDADAFVAGRKIGVAVFEVGGGGVGSNAGPLEKPRQILLEQFQKDLKKEKYFSAVSMVTADSPSNADYVLEGNLLGLNGGSRAGRYFIGGFGSMGQMRVNGRILGAGAGDSRPVLSDWECNVFNPGGPFDFGGANDKLARQNARFVSAMVTRQIGSLLKGKEGKTKLDKMEAKVEKDADRSPITGKSEAKNRSWREKPDWQPKDFLNEIDSFIVRSHQARSRGVDVLWLTKACFDAHARFLPSMKQTAILKTHDLKRGMLTDLEPVKPFVDQDAVVLLATFDVHATAAPFLWDAKRIKSATYLTHGRSGDDKLLPSQFLDDKIASYMVFDEKRIAQAFSSFRAFHPVLLVFPTKRPDGTPFFQSVDDVAELHTEVDGRQVQITFDLKDFDLKSLDDLKMGGPAPKGE